MDLSNPGADAAGEKPPKRMLVLAALVPFGVIGLLALPLAFNFLRHLAGF